MRFLLHLQPLLYLAFVAGGVYFGLHQSTNVLSNTKKKDAEWWTTLLRSINLICIVHTIPVFIGYLWPHRISRNYRESLRNQNGGQLPNLHIRFVTRGTQPDVIVESVKKALDVSKDDENVYVEVVTDKPVIMTPEFIEKNYRNLLELVVPKDYSTENYTIFKARALQYALEKSPADSTDYILHMDEESHLTPEALKGIYQHMYQNPDRIGQGVITYKRSLYTGWKNWKKSFCTLADSIRIADDLSRFRLSFNIGNPFFGCKGSYIVVKNSIERDIGFDMSPKLCITEDASFAFNSYQRNFKFAFVEGQIEEISPGSFIDFIEQRARWMRGLWLLVWNHSCSKWRKFGILLGMITWSLIFLNLISLVAFFALSDYALPTSIAVINGAIFATYIFSYCFGGLVGGYGLISFLSIILTPLFLILETIGTLRALYDLITKKKNFHIIKK